MSTKAAMEGNTSLFGPNLAFVLRRSISRSQSNRIEIFVHALLDDGIPDVEKVDSNDANKKPQVITANGHNGCRAHLTVRPHCDPSCCRWPAMELRC